MENWRAVSGGFTTQERQFQPIFSLEDLKKAFNAGAEYDRLTVDGNGDTLNEDFQDYIKTIYELEV